MRLPRDASDRIAAAIARAEALTSAELVVVAVPFSGSYRDVDLGCGAACATLALLFVLFSPLSVPPWAVTPGVLLAGALGAVACRFTPAVRGVLVGGARRASQARDAARLAFLGQGVDATRRRTGVLVHVSFLERAVTLVCDRGVREEVSGDEVAAQERALVAALQGADPVSGLCDALVALGGFLGKRLPRDADDADELSNVPVMDAAP